MQNLRFMDHLAGKMSGFKFAFQMYYSFKLSFSSQNLFFKRRLEVSFIFLGVGGLFLGPFSRDFTVYFTKKWKVARVHDRALILCFEKWLVFK